ncbi:RRP36 [Candida oxycetoniae]|uniref:rRNA biogenesis protein RRP36 n=1 Tax=Candida oxycetoniae TaxID=497107 RepID=A0AAI9WY48_9ASCO|nr:RRP36 [Candida oxycetoniae]KAI3405001.2 RRP36 [Candida oxycetoniae]
MLRDKKRPVFKDEDSSDEDVRHYRDPATKSRGEWQGEEESEEESEGQDDIMSKLSFGTLNKMQSKLQREDSRKGERINRRNGRDVINIGDRGVSEDSQDSEDSEESESDTAPKVSTSTKKKTSKHAPAVSSSKKPVSKIREIPGLPSRKTHTLYKDIRFDAAYGKADLNQARKNYAFLDDYRRDEISKMEDILKDKKSKLNQHEREEIERQLQSLKSRMDSLKNRDIENSILSEYKKKQYQNVKNGSATQPYFLKRSEQRKILKKAKYDSMKPRQREKAMERKRKKRLGKEFRQLEFRVNNQ